MIDKPDDRQPMSHRARKYVRGIALAVTLTFAALLFLYATLYGETQTEARAVGLTPTETSSISRTQ